MSDSLQPHGLQHTRLPCPSLTPETCSDSCPLRQWCHPTISSCRPLLLPSVFPGIRVFSSSSHQGLSQLFTSSCQSIGASASASVLPVNIQGWFPLGWTGLISLLSKGQSLLQHHSQKHQLGELDHKEGWMPKNWCFWTVFLAMPFANILSCAVGCFPLWFPLLCKSF